MSIRYRVVGAGVGLALALLLALAPPPGGAGDPDKAIGPVALRVLPGGVVLYSWRRQRCASWDIPDTPARAWRSANGVVTLIAGAEANRASVGPSLDALSRDCAVRLEGPANPDPAALSDRWWIASLYAHSDGTVEALVHAEYHGHSHPGACDRRIYLICWRNAILAAVSTDGGRSFAVDTAHPVAALRYPYDPGQTGRSGYFSPSNMILSEGHLYAFIFAAPYRDQRRGVCLIRRKVDGTAEDWRAWDGLRFTLRLDNSGAAGGGAVCPPLPRVQGNLTSVVERAGRYLAISPMTARDRDGTVRSGFWALESRDLVHWSRPVLLLERPLLWKPDCSAPYAYAYPAFIDPKSSDRNFATVSDRFWLSFVRMRLTPDCRAGRERDLIARDVVDVASLLGFVGNERHR